MHRNKSGKKVYKCTCNLILRNVFINIVCKFTKVWKYIVAKNIGFFESFSNLMSQVSIINNSYTLSWYKNVDTGCYNFLCDLIKFHALNLNVESVRAFRDMGNDKKAFWNPLKRDFRFQWSRKLPRLENIWNLLLHCYFTKELKVVIVRKICIQKSRIFSDFWAIYEWPWSWEFERSFLPIKLSIQWSKQKSNDVHGC